MGYSGCQYKGEKRRNAAQDDIATEDSRHAWLNRLYQGAFEARLLPSIQPLMMLWLLRFNGRNNFAGENDEVKDIKMRFLVLPMIRSAEVPPRSIKNSPITLFGAYGL